jgi:hypothetical protein
MENWNMSLQTNPIILLIGTDGTLRYLLARFAEQSGFRWKVIPDQVTSREIAELNPAAVVFLSTELLARDPGLVTELSHLDAPIMVCSSVLEEARARELGVDYCLLHPLTYHDFQVMLETIKDPKRT